MPTTTTAPSPHHSPTFQAPDLASGDSRLRSAAVWILSVGAAGMFLMAGWAKVSGAPAMVGLFDAVGFGQWFRHVTGAIEVAGAVGLLIPAAAAFAGAALAATMLGAIATHLFIVGGSIAVPAVLLAATSFVAWTRWSRR